MILLPVLLIGYAIGITVFQFRPNVIVRPHPEYKETSYVLIDESGDELSLTTYKTELNKGILRLRSNSDLPLDTQISMLDRILRRVLKDEKRSELRTLFIGRLINTFGKTNTQMSERLSTAAYRSPKWDKIKGKPVSGHENDFVQNIANEAMIYPELREVFKRHGLLIEFSSAEKVLIDPSDRLPYDCLTWFSIRETK